MIPLSWILKHVVTTTAAKIKLSPSLGKIMKFFFSHVLISYIWVPHTVKGGFIKYSLVGSTDVREDSHEIISYN